MSEQESNLFKLFQRANRRKTKSHRAKHPISTTPPHRSRKTHKAFKVRLRLFLENLTDYCEWPPLLHCFYCQTNQADSSKLSPLDFVYNQYVLIKLLIINHNFATIDYIHTLLQLTQIIHLNLAATEVVNCQL